MHPVAMRAAIYCRISKSDPSVPKVRVQEDDCRRLAAGSGYNVTAVYEDDGVSASTFKDRPGWQQLLADIGAGGIDVILAVEEERFTRQPMEKEMLALACTSAGVVWHTVRGGLIDPATAEGEFISALTGILARREVRRKSERQRSGNEARRLRGEPLTGVRPFGFELNRIDHREAEAAEIRWASAKILDGGSLWAILKKWNSEGVKTSLGNLWSYATVQQLLGRPRNAGLMEKDGEILEDVPVKWEPIVSREDWQAVRDILSDPQRRLTTNREPRWLCAGIARCGVCGDVLRSGSGSDRKSSFRVYRCASKVRAVDDGRTHSTVKTADLDPMVRDAVVATYLFAPKAAASSDSPEVADLRRLQSRLREVRHGLTEINEMVGTPGFTRARMARRAAEFAIEEADLEAKIAEYTRRSAHAAMLTESVAALWSKGHGPRVSIDKAGDLKVELGERFDSLPLDQRRTLVRSMLRVTVQPGRRRDRVQIEHLMAPGLDDPDES